MKSLLVAALMLSSLSSLAQSFVHQESGKLLTVDKLGFIYDLDITVDPGSIKNKGKNWFKTKDAITTISADGLMAVQTGVALPRSIKATGGSWLIGKNSELVIVASSGAVTVVTEPLMNDVKVLNSGANWLVIRAKDRSIHMVTIDTNNGRHYSISAQALQSGPLALNVNMLRNWGGNWMADSNGILFVVRADGGIMSKRELGIFLAMHSKGGNFFVDIRNRTQVILDNGYVVLPYLPMTYGTLVKTSSQVAWNTQNDFFTFAETHAAADASAYSNSAAMERLMRSLIKQPVNVQIDMRSLAE